MLIREQLKPSDERDARLIEALTAEFDAYSGEEGLSAATNTLSAIGEAMAADAEAASKAEEGTEARAADSKASAKAEQQQGIDGGASAAEAICTGNSAQPAAPDPAGV